MLAMVANDDAGCLMPRGDLRFFASMLAPTGWRCLRRHLPLLPPLVPWNAPHYLRNFIPSTVEAPLGQT